MREATSSGRVLGPRIFAAGPILDDAPGDWPFRMRVKTADDGRAAVQLLKRRGVDLIKVHDYTPRDVFFAIADEARPPEAAARRPCAVEGDSPRRSSTPDRRHRASVGDLALWMPCSGGPQYRPEACRPFFEMLARRGIWQTPTLLAMSEIATIGTPASAISADQLAYASKRSLRACGPAIRASSSSARSGADPEEPAPRSAAVVTSDMAKAGVGILAGCDAMIAGFCVHDEFAAMVRGGMTPLAALQTATLNPARYFGLSADRRQRRAGRRADLVLLDANPLTDIAQRRTHSRRGRRGSVPGQERAGHAAGTSEDRGESSVTLLV